MLPRLSEATAGTTPDRPPVGIVHLGAGAFHRAHQAAFTADVPGEWGICAVAPRRRDAVETWRPRTGCSRLLVRHPDEDRARVIGCLRELLHAPSEPAGSWPGSPSRASTWSR